MPATPSRDTWWLNQIKKHDAVYITALKAAPRFPDRAVAFETRNFGWILSARNAAGHRTILLKY